METHATSSAPGERALCVFMKWTMARPLSAFADDARERLATYEMRQLLLRLPERLRDALRSVAQQVQRAAVVSRLACVSNDANALAAEASMGPQVRDACVAKLVAMRDIFSFTRDERILFQGVQTELIRRCAPGALPFTRPRNVLDSAENWRTVARCIREQLTDREVIVRAAEWHAQQQGPDNQRLAHLLRSGEVYYVAALRVGQLLAIFGAHVDDLTFAEYR
jgi:hypothetical protein